MKLPKKIERALQLRASAAVRYSYYDNIVSAYIQSHGIPVEEYDYMGGCETICNPYTSSDRVRQAIDSFQKKNTST